MKTRPWIAFLLAMLLVLGMVGCDTGTTDPAETTGSQESESAEGSGAETTGQPGSETTGSPDSGIGDPDPIIPEPTKATVTVANDGKSLTAQVPNGGMPSGMSLVKSDSTPAIGLGLLRVSTGISMIPENGTDGKVSATYTLSGDVASFSTIVGIGDNAPETVRAEFIVTCDGYVMARSGEMKRGEVLTLQAEVYGSNEMTLEVVRCDKADAVGCEAIWAFPTLFAQPNASVKLSVNYLPKANAYVDEMKWKSFKIVTGIAEPFRNKNDGGSAIKLGGGTAAPKHAVWLHPNAGAANSSYAEVVLDIKDQGYTDFYAMCGLEDGYLAVVDSQMGTVARNMRSVVFRILVDGKTVAEHEAVNVAKLGFIHVDVTGASTVSIRLTNYDGSHTCDAAAISAGFTIGQVGNEQTVPEPSEDDPSVDTPSDDDPVVPPSVNIPAAPVKLPQAGEDWCAETDTAYLTPDGAFVPKNHYPADDLLICVANILDFGAKADGVTDDSEALNQAIQAAKNKGGGTVYLPAGTYRIDQAIVLPNGVTLSGDWVSPEKEPAGTRGTILLTDYGKGVDNDTRGFLKPALSCGIRNLTIYYPNQDPENPTPYAPTIWMPANSQPTIENVTILNAWRAVSLGRSGQSGLSSITNTYITALKEGIYLDMTLDNTRFEGVHVSPRYWAENVISPLSDAQVAALESYTFANCVGITMGRGDGTGSYDVFFELCHIGMLLTNSPTGNGCTSGSITLFEAKNCDYGLYLEYAHAVGTSVTGFTAYATRPCTAAIYTASTYKENLKLQDVRIEGSFASAIKADGAALLNLITGEITLTGEGTALSGTSAVFSCTEIAFGNSLVASLTETRGALTLRGCSFATEPIFHLRDAKNLVRDDTALAVTPVPGYHEYKETLPMPASLRIVSITQFGAVAGAELGCADAIQAALDYMASRGGGIVLIPNGKFLLEKPITVPEGVELAGQLGNWCYVGSAFGSSCFLIRAGEQDPDGEAAINLQKNAGLRGFVAWYPEQNYMDVVPYSYTIRSHGENCYAINVNVPNAYQYLDFGSVESTGHYIRCCAGSFIKIGMFIGNNSGEGWVENVHLNQHQPYELSINKQPGGYEPSQFNTVVYDILIHSAEAFIFGYNENEHVIGAFSLGQKIGYRFIEQNGKGTSGIFIQPASDGCANSYTIEQAGNLYLIDSGSVALGDSLKSYIRTTSAMTGNLHVIGGGGFGGPTYCVLVEGGNLTIQGFTFAAFGSTCPMHVIGGASVNMFSNVIPYDTPVSSRVLGNFKGALSAQGNLRIGKTNESASWTVYDPFAE